MSLTFSLQVVLLAFLLTALLLTRVQVRAIILSLEVAMPDRPDVKALLR